MKIYCRSVLRTRGNQKASSSMKFLRRKANYNASIKKSTSWGDVKTIKSGKISAISSDVSEKQIIVYTYTCIE